MFSIAICISSSSVLGQRIPFLQHIASVALVMAVKEQPGYEVSVVVYRDTFKEEIICIQNFFIPDLQYNE